MFFSIGLRQPLPRSLIRSAKAIRKYATGSQSTNLVLAHFSRIMRHVLTYTYNDSWIGRGGPTVWPPGSTVWPVRRPKTPCACRFCRQGRYTSPSHCGCLWDYPQLSWHLWTDMAVHDETCRGVRCILLRIFWALTKCNLSAVTHKVDVSGNVLM
jgi:hypothetical protein